MTTEQELTPSYLQKLSQTIHDHSKEQIPLSQIETKDQAESVIGQLDQLTDSFKSDIARSMNQSLEDLESKLQLVRTWARAQVAKANRP